jgi:hypothetical protein
VEFASPCSRNSFTTGKRCLSSIARITCICYPTQVWYLINFRSYIIIIFFYSSDPHLWDFIEAEFLDEQVIKYFNLKLFILFFLIGEINQRIRRLHYQLETCWYRSWRIYLR